VETIQNNFQLIDQVLENISFREKEAGAASVAFQEVVIAMTKRETCSSFRFSIPEQTRGNILLKEWERNISEGRQQAKEVIKSCEETFGFVDLRGSPSVGYIHQRNCQVLPLLLSSK
jgi:hypothetical protein